MNTRTLRRIERAADTLLLALAVTLGIAVVADPRSPIVAWLLAPIAALMVVSITAEVKRRARATEAGA